jgi:hypothetical protein
MKSRTGMGAMAEWTDIVQLVVSRWSLSPKQSASHVSATSSTPSIVIQSAPENTHTSLADGIPTLEELARDYPPMFTWEEVKSQVDSG